MCFEDRETCRAFIQQLGLQPAQCERRQKGIGAGQRQTSEPR